MPLPPNWNKFKKVVDDMIDYNMGAQPCIISVPSTITYDFEEGEIEGEDIDTPVNLALIPINYKDDLKDIPEGLRNKVTRRVFSKKPLPNNATITTLFDNVKDRISSSYNKVSFPFDTRRSMKKFPQFKKFLGIIAVCSYSPALCS